MDEFDFINSIKPEFYKQSALIKGIGDDAAIFRGHDNIAISSDTFVDGVHFTNQTATSFHIGYRAMAANLSDMAAMGAIPKFYLVSIVIPKGRSMGSIQQIFDGMASSATQYHLDLIGGDTVSGKELVISITIIGFITQKSACLRSNAKEDDLVFVTGTLGDSRAGLEMLLNKETNYDNKEYFIRQHQMPNPRIEIGEQLSTFDRVALNDVSDGIASELREVAEASNVSIEIEDRNIPLHKDMEQFTPAEQFDWKYFGGEDFELVGTTSQKNRELLNNVSLKSGIAITIIGKVIPKRVKAAVYLKRDEKIIPLLKKGYTHLK